MSKKKICIITQCNLPVPAINGGAVETLVEYLINENEKNYKFDFWVITIFSDEAKRKALTYKHTKFVYINESGLPLKRIYNFLYKVLKKINIYLPFSLEYFRVINYLKNNGDTFDYCIYEAGPTTQVPIISRYINHNKIIVHLHWNGLGNKKKSNSFKYLFPVSDYIGNCWEKSTKDCSNTSYTLDNCVDIATFDRKISAEEKIGLQKELTIDSTEFVIIYVGRLVPEKGVLELLQAIEEVKYSNISTVIVGSSNFGKVTATKYEKTIEDYISNMKKKVILTGYVHQTELYKYYSLANIAIMPSVFDEPAGLVCLETQAFGIPLIATKVGGIPEYAADSTILIDRQNMVTEIKEKIEFLYENPQLIESMIQNGRENVKKYSTKRYFEQFTDLIKTIGEDADD